MTTLRDANQPCNDTAGYLVQGREVFGAEPCDRESDSEATMKHPEKTVPDPDLRIRPVLGWLCVFCVGVSHLSFPRASGGGDHRRPRPHIQI